MESMDVKSSVVYLLDEVRSLSNALLSLAKSETGSRVDLKNDVEPIRKSLIELRGMRATYPAEVTKVIQDNAPNVGEAYEAVMDVSDMVDAGRQREITDLALEIRFYCNLRDRARDASVVQIARSPAPPQSSTPVARNNSIARSPVVPDEGFSTRVALGREG
jgi:hypothetical protein